MSCASVAAMFNDAATCLEQRTRELAARIRAVADDFDSNEGRSTVTIAASGEGGIVMASVQGLECVCPVDAAPVYQFAESLKDQNKTFEDARGDLHNARTTITSSMTSRATDSLIDELDRQIARIDETVTHRQTLIDATMTFHDEIVTCKARFSNIKFQALCNGLTVMTIRLSTLRCPVLRNRVLLLLVRATRLLVKPPITHTAIFRQRKKRIGRPVHH